MVIDRIIKVLSEFLEIEQYEIDENTMLFLEYDLSDEDIDDIIDLLNEELDIEIDKDEFCELSNIEEFAEYIEGII